MADRQPHLQNDFVHLSTAPPPECCCGCSIQTGTKIVAIFSLLMGMFAFAIIILLIADLRQDSGFGTIFVVVLWSVIILVEISFSTFLLVGAIKVNLEYCRSWIISTKVIAISSGCMAVFSLVTLNIGGAVGQVASVVKYLYLISVVETFVSDVEDKPSRYYGSSNGQHG